MANTDLEITVKATDEASPALKSVGDNSDGMANKVESSATKAKAALGALAGFVTGTLVGAFADAAKAGEEEEAQIRGLAQAVDNSGGSWAKSGDAIQDQIQKWQDATGFADSELRPALTQLTGVTGSYEEAMKRLPVAMDLARGTGMSLASASTLLSKVTDESASALSRYGLSFEKGTSAAEVMTAVTAKFGGTAEATRKQTDVWKNSLGDLQETIGESLGPFESVIAMLPGLSAGFSAITTAGGAVIPAVISLTSSLWAMVPAAVAAAAPFLPIILILGAVVLAVVALKVAWENNLGDIQRKAKAFGDWIYSWAHGFIDIGGNIVRGLWEGISGAWGWLYDNTLGKFGGLMDGVKNFLGIHSNSMEFNSIGGYMMGGLGDGIDDGMADVQSRMRGGLATLFAESKANAAQFSGVGTAIGSAISGAIKITLPNITVPTIGAPGSSPFVPSTGSAPNPGQLNQDSITFLQNWITAHPGQQIAGVPGYDVGGRVRKTELALVHEGEHVLKSGESVIDYDRLASAIARALSGVSLSVGVDDIHSALLRKSSRTGGLALA